jgi:hypothetical protein
LTAFIVLTEEGREEILVWKEEKRGRNGFKYEDKKEAIPHWISRGLF